MNKQAIFILTGVAIISVAVYFLLKPKAFSKTTLSMGDGGGPAVAIHLPIKPYGMAQFIAEDDSDDSLRLVDELVTVWPELWPKMRAYLETAMKDYGVDTELGRDKFMGSIGRTDPDSYMGDTSDIMLSIMFERNTVPMWDFFIRGASMTHSQPVF